MADPAAEAIRYLKFPPTPKWGPHGPRTKTLREDISRWYEPAGGIDRAIAGAQQSMQQTELPFKPWDVSDLDAQVPVERVSMPYSRQGEYDPGRRKIVLNSDKPPSQYTLEHERSHSVFGPSDWQTPGVSADETRFADSGSTNYITSPSEIDVRLANIKRHYAYNTGRIVNTPEEAERAIKWWGRNSDDFQDEVPAMERPGWKPKTEAGTYLLLPEEQKQKVLRRMPELVNSDLIERLGEYG
jgi:hypothetical protein